MSLQVNRSQANMASLGSPALPPENGRQRFKHYVQTLQDTICSALEELDGQKRFQEDTWQRPGGGVDAPE